MREYILTKIERKIIQDYLNEEIKSKDLPVLLFRIRGSIKRLRDDMKLISILLEKIGE